MIKHCLTPEWSYEHYTDEGIYRFFEENPDTEFPLISDKFKGIVRGEHKADLFRYYYLYKKGGVFIDSDAMIYQPIDSIVRDYKFFSVESTNVPNTMFQGVIGAEPQNPLVYGALKSMYSMDLTSLQGCYQIICADIFSLYKTTFQDDPAYVLFKEVPHKVADKIVDSSDAILFKHYWRNKEGVPNYLPNMKLYKRMESGISKRKQFLVYFCVFYNQDYFRLLELLLKSITMFSKTDKIDLLVFTNREFEPAVHNLAVDLNLFLYVKTFNFTTIFQAACARLYIFDYEYINSYEKIFYLDTDIIIKKDITPIFDLDLAEVLYGLECGTISSPSFGCYLFDLATIDPNTTGINSGSLLFKNCKTIRDLFSRMQKNINEHTKAGLPIPYCMDQPFINYHAIIGNLYDNKYLNSHISLYEGNDEVNNYETSSICHFSYPIGNFQHKYDRMDRFLKKILNDTETVGTSTESWVHNIVGCMYSWAHGFIEFKANCIITTWGTGEYSVKGKNKLEIQWNHHHHIIQFNDDYTKYSCLRTYPADLIYISGSIVNSMSRLYIYGDSHAYVSFMNLKIPHINFYDLNGITMHRIGRDREILKFNKVHCSPDSVFCFCYGEVDVRCHIGKQLSMGRKESEICLELVKQYFETIRTNIIEYKGIIVVGIVPPVRVEDHVHADHIPFIGTNQERVHYTATMNNYIAQLCCEYGYNYFNPYAAYVDTDGCMNSALSDKCVHVGPNEDVLKKFGELYDNINRPLPPKSVGFIMLRHVSNSLTNEYWIHSYNSIRKFYPENEILIIDDNSNSIYLTQMELYKTTIIYSEFPGRGELLPYYYYLKHKLFDIAVIIHDSVFMNYTFDFSGINKYKFLWEFNELHKYNIDDIHLIFSKFNDKSLRQLFDTPTEWKGCFGGMCIINHDYLVQIDRKYKINTLLDYVLTRNNRCSFERIIGVLLYSDFKQPTTLLGYIHQYCRWGITFKEKEQYNHLPIIKVWSGR